MLSRALESPYASLSSSLALGHRGIIFSPYLPSYNSNFWLNSKLLLAVLQISFLHGFQFLNETQCVFTKCSVLISSPFSGIFKKTVVLLDPSQMSRDF